MYTYRLLKRYNVFGYNDSGMVPNHPNYLHQLSLSSNSGLSAHPSEHRMSASMINSLNSDISLSGGSSNDHLVSDEDLEMSGYVVGGGVGISSTSANRKSATSPTNPAGVVTGIAMQPQTHQFHYFPSGAAMTSDGSGNVPTTTKGD